MRCRPINEGAGLAGLRLGTAAVAEFGPQGQELGLWWLLWRHKPVVEKGNKIRLYGFFLTLKLYILISHFIKYDYLVQKMLPKLSNKNQHYL